MNTSQMSGLDENMNLASVWEQIADAQPEALALANADTSRTWAEFDDRASRLAGALEAAGIGAGDNVACAMYNGNEYIEAEFAAFKARAAPCNVNYRYVEAELQYLIDNSDSKAVFFDSSLAERFGNVRDQLPGVQLWIQVGGDSVPDWAVGYETVIADNEPAARIERSGQDLWILYTGGTTGNPKGVMWPHENILTVTKRIFELLALEFPTSLDQTGAAAAAIAELGATPRQLAASPLMHGTAGIGALMYLTCGGAVVTMTSRSLDSDELWQTVQTRQCTVASIVGDVFCTPMVDALDAAAEAGSPYDLTSLASITSSGVMWSQPVKDRLLAHAHAGGTTLICNDSLGSSEGVGFAGKQSSAGKGTDTKTATFTLGPNAAVFTEDGRRVEPGSDEKGLLAVGGPIPLGYYGDPVKSAETFREIEGQRWSVPGDWATVAADGSVTLLGRGSMSINTGGEKVYPEEVEEALKLLDDVVDANVVGVPDPKWGAAVTAVVQLTDGATPADSDLVDALRSSLSGYKLPKHVIRVEKLFRSPNGKSDYKWAIKTAHEALGINQ
ncbi:MAG: acyl-CoA synthetase (AMP-forming)/AMP-acid ligase II [Acidimicrobiales bacterium]|jgi:acyl-CoA synthetase (AMP-forming)/AMP-acid ligase II